MLSKILKLISSEETKTFILIAKHYDQHFNISNSTLCCDEFNSNVWNYHPLGQKCFSYKLQLKIHIDLLSDTIGFYTWHTNHSPLPSVKSVRKSIHQDNTLPVPMNIKGITQFINAFPSTKNIWNITEFVHFLKLI